MATATDGLLMFPHSLVELEAVGLLAPWFGPLELVMPPGGGPGVQPPELVSAGVLNILTPAPGTEPESGQKRLGGLLAQWEDWLGQQRGSGRAEMLKFGIKPPPQLESVGDIMRGIKDPESVKAQAAPASPQASAGLIMHLALLQDLQSREADAILEQVDRKQSDLGSILGVSQEGEPDPDYLKTAGPSLPPAAYRWDEGTALARRVAAWATLAAGLAPAGGVLATTSPEAAQLVVERANRRFLANAATPLPGLPLAQGAARFNLPVLAGNTEAELAHAVEAVREKPGFEQLAGAWAKIQAVLTGEKWSRHLPETLTAPAGDISRLARELAGGEGRTREVVLLAFPGLDREKLMTLMRDEGQDLLSPARDWPEAWPDGSCPLLVLPPS